MLMFRSGRECGTVVVRANDLPAGPFERQSSPNSARAAQTAPQPSPILVDKNGSCPAASVALASQAPFTPRLPVGLTFSWLAELGSDGLELAQRGQPRQRLALELPDALAGQVELVADRLERPRLALEAEAQLEDAPFPLGQGVEGPADTLAEERLLGLVERVGSLAVGEEIAELALVIRPEGLVQRDRRLGGTERFVDVLDRQARGLGELLLRRLATELDLEPARGAPELLLPLDHVHGHADRARVVRDRALHRLADPPRRVRRELVAAAPVELLDRAVEAERSLLDQVQERDAEPAVTLRDRDDQAQVRLDHPALGGQVAALDRLREHDLLGRSQQLVAADIGQEELQAVGGADEHLRLGLLGGLLGLLAFGARLAHLEA